MAALIIAIAFFLPSAALAFMSDADVATLQRELADKPPGLRIAVWAEKFVGTPYDTDPDGEYVTRKTIVADDRVDCMYLVFRAVELAFGKDPSDSVRIALDKRFMHTGKMENDLVLNYEDRFRYGEDMIESGKWGHEVTGELGNTITISGSRAREKTAIVPKDEACLNMSLLHTGDIVFFIKSPENKLSDEIVGHMGIISKEGNQIFMIHAGGVKNRGGTVTKVLFSDYLNKMPFIGIRVSRFGA